MNQLRSDSLSSVAILILCLFVAGCASFAGGQLPEQSAQGLTDHGLTVDYEAEWLTFGAANENVRKSFSKSIRDVLEESRMFSEISYSSGQAPLHLHFVMRNEGNIGAAVLLGFLSGLTLTVLPAYARDDYILSVEVSGAEQTFKTYEYKDHLKSWIQLFLVFAMPGRSAAEVGGRVHANMLWNFLHDFQGDITSGDIPAIESGPVPTADNAAFPNSLLR
jgi:hypothetical protein